MDDFPAAWNYGKLSAKFLVSNLRVIDTVGFLSIFFCFTLATIKIPLVPSYHFCFVQDINSAYIGCSVAVFLKMGDLFKRLTVLREVAKRRINSNDFLGAAQTLTDALEQIPPSSHKQKRDKIISEVLKERSFAYFKAGNYFQASEDFNHAPVLEDTDEFLPIVSRLFIRLFEFLFEQLGMGNWSVRYLIFMT